MNSLQHITHYYFIGIGGIGMSGLARYLNQQGKQVAGYDRVNTILTQQLESEGIHIHYQDNFDDISAAFKNPTTSLVIYTPAVPVDMGELIRFRESGITTIKRAQLLGQLSRTMTCLAVAGTHGKTTTTAILAHLLYQSSVALTAFCGGILEEYQTNYLHSGNQVMVVEADEFDRSFMQLSPDIAGITAMDADHLDIYGDVATFEQTFVEFASMLNHKTLLVNHQINLDGIQVGIDHGYYKVDHLRIVDGCYEFTLVVGDFLYPDFRLQLPGRHNLSNAVLALAMAIEYGVTIDKLRLALSSFKGVQRRFTYRVNTSKMVLIDDYAHHPTEIDALHDAIREMYPDDQITAVFQPHLYSRTRDFIQEFTLSLSRFDQLALLDIYPAREQPIKGVSSQLLVDKIKNHLQSSNQVVLLSKDQIPDYIKRVENRVVVMLGAGDIGVEIIKLTQILISNET